jgi:hypothetical protein
MSYGDSDAELEDARIMAAMNAHAARNREPIDSHAALKDEWGIELDAPPAEGRVVESAHTECHRRWLEERAARERAERSARSAYVESDARRAQSVEFLAGWRHTERQLKAWALAAICGWGVLVYLISAQVIR